MYNIGFVGRPTRHRIADLLVLLGNSSSSLPRLFSTSSGLSSFSSRSQLLLIRDTSQVHWRPKPWHFQQQTRSRSVASRSETLLHQHTFAPNDPAIEGCDCSDLQAIIRRARRIAARKRSASQDPNPSMSLSGDSGVCVSAISDVVDKTQSSTTTTTASTTKCINNNNNICVDHTASTSGVPTETDCICANVINEMSKSPPHTSLITRQYSINEADLSTLHDSQKIPRFAPKRVLILTKLTRLEFERRTNPGCTEEELRDLLVRRGSDYKHLHNRHNYHQEYLDCVCNELKTHGIEYRVVHRFEYTDEAVAWSDAVFSAGGDGTFLLAASRLFDPDKPLIGINTDPIGSEGYMCLMNKLSYEYFPSAFKRLLTGDFAWMWRQRIRITMVGPDAWTDPIELHDQQLLHPELRWLDHMHENDDTQQSGKSTSRSRSCTRIIKNEECKARVQSTIGGTTSSSPSLSRGHSSRQRGSTADVIPASQINGHVPNVTPRVLPYLALNEVFMGESVSSRVSYFEIKLDEEANMSKQKNSGITVCTGTGSTSWYFNINRMTNRCVEEIMRILNDETKSSLNPKDRALVDRVTSRFNDQLIFDPAELKMAYTIRDPVSNATFKCDRPRGFTRLAEIKSRCFDAHLVIDGGMSFPFNNGSRALLEIRPRDALRTVTFR